MALGAELLPQSALPVGQTPLATIQAPTVPVSVPNPIDVSNFFRMQQGMQNNLSVLQSAEQLKMQRQQMDLQNYEDSLKRMDETLKMVNGAFSDFYNQQTSGRSKNTAASSPVLSDLDPTRLRHSEAMRRGNAIIDNAQAKADELGMSLLATGGADPETTMEVAGEIRKIVAGARRELEQDKELFELSTMHRAYNDWLDKLKQAETKGFNIDADAVDKMQQEYDRWTEDGTGNIHLNRFRIDDYVYKAGDALKAITADAKALGEGVDEFTEVPTSGGAVLEGTRTTRRTLDDITQTLYDKYSKDKNTVALYKNAVRVQKMLDPEAPTTSFRDWIKELAAPYAPADGKESIISDTGSYLVKPGSVQTDPSKGGSRTTSTGSGSTKKGYDNAGLINVLGRDPKDVNERDVVEIGNTIQQRGFDVTRGNIDLTPYDWSKIATLDSKNRLDMVEVKADGGAVSRGKGDYIEIWDKGFTNDEGVVEIPEQLIAKFPKAPKTNEGKDATPAPKGSVYQHQIRPEIMGASGDSLAIKNNNPGNVRATQSQKESWDSALEEVDGDKQAAEEMLGYGIDDKGFLRFASIEKGIEAGGADINYKLDGRSNKFAKNAFLIEKYGKDALAEGKYLDVATVEDFMHVYSPRKDYGGDNSMEAFEAKLKLFEKRGFPRDLKIKDIQDRANFIATMFESEDRDMYDMLYGSGGYMPAAHQDEIVVADAPDTEEVAMAREQGLEPKKQATLSGPGLARDVFDRLILDEPVEDQELEHMFKNAPDDLKEILEEAKTTWDDRKKKDAEYQKLIGKREIAERTGKSLSEKETSRIVQLENELIGGEDTQATLGKLVRAKVAKSIEPRIMNQMIDGLFSDESFPSGGSIDFTFKPGRYGNVKQGVSIIKSQSLPDTYGMVTFSEPEGMDRRSGEIEMMTGAEVRKFIKSQMPRFDEDSAMQLMNPEAVSNYVREIAFGSKNARDQALTSQQLQLDQMARGKNDTVMEEEKVKAKEPVSLESKWNF